MTALQPCAGCRRHIDALARVCPFCGIFGRISRAAMFVGAVLASTACGGTKPKAEPVDQNQNQQQSEAIAADAGLTDAGVTDAGVTGRRGTDPGVLEGPMKGQQEDPDDWRKRRRHRSDEGGPPMPYGAPPARRRVV